MLSHRSIIYLNRSISVVCPAWLKYIVDSSLDHLFWISTTEHRVYPLRQLRMLTARIARGWHGMLRRGHICAVGFGNNMPVSNQPTYIMQHIPVDKQQENRTSTTLVRSTRTSNINLSNQSRQSTITTPFHCQTCSNALRSLGLRSGSQ